MGVKLGGKLVFVKCEKSKEKGTPYKRLQLLVNGGETRAILYNVNDMSNGNWTYGDDIELDVSIDVYVAKNGTAGISFTHWGQRVQAPAGPLQAKTGQSKYA